MPTIGIDAIALAVPEGYLDLADLAAARGVPAGKYVDGLGVAAHGGRRASTKIRSRSPPPPRAGCSPRRASIRRRSACASSAPRPRSITPSRSPPTCTACSGCRSSAACSRPSTPASAAPRACSRALDWIAAGSARGRKALIVCTDIARYGLNTPGEPTQGAGAVAILVSENPRLLALEVGVTGSYAQDVNDFWRPLYSQGGRRRRAPLGAVLPRRARRRLQGLAGSLAATGNTDTLARRCYHVPYGKMAKKAHRHVMQLEGATEAEADASYTAEVATSLRLPSQVGNIYTGSLYLALASLLEAEAADARGAAHRPLQLRVGLLRRVLRRPRASGAGAFADALAAGGAAQGSHASTRSPSTSRSACATTRATSARSTARRTACPRASSASSASTPIAASTSPSRASAFLRASPPTGRTSAAARAAFRDGEPPLPEARACRERLEAVGVGPLAQRLDAAARRRATAPRISRHRMRELPHDVRVLEVALAVEPAARRQRRARQRHVVADAVLPAMRARRRESRGTSAAARRRAPSAPGGTRG